MQDQCNRLKGSELLVKVNMIYSTKIMNIPQAGHNFFLKKQKQNSLGLDARGSMKELERASYTNISMSYFMKSVLGITQY